MPENYWLFKAEPDSRIVKGKDVKFSVDDFEAVKTSPWEGVRNYEARNLMKEMRVGDKALFYQSNCKNPGVAAFAEVSKEAYPDHSAWDPEHPYYDPKTDKDNPKWYMVDLTFKSRAEHFVPLALLKRIADSPSDQTPKDVSYIGSQGCKAIKEMDLVTRGRLSVQRVSEKAWVVIQLLAETGGWDEVPMKKVRQKSARKRAVQSEEPHRSEEEKDLSNVEDMARGESKNSAKKRKREATASADRNEDNGAEKPLKHKATRSQKRSVASRA